jgi:predicted O-methyltransferase YrrM
VSVLHRSKQILRIARSVLRHGPGPLRLARRAMREHGALQRTWELQSLVSEVRALRPRTVVEIGTHRGGTLACWAAVADPGAHLVSIDLPNEVDGLGTTEDDLRRLRAVLRPGQRLSAIRADSHAASTLDRLREVLGGAAVDLLWIDGDHLEEGARQDVRMYAPLVRPGGMVALHDIHPDPAFPRNQSHVVWNELKARYPYRELIDQDHPGGVGMGIGVLRVERPIVI